MAVCASPKHIITLFCSVLYYAILYLCLCIRDVYHEEKRGIESHRVDQPNLSRSQTRTERNEVTRSERGELRVEKRSEAKGYGTGWDQGEKDERGGI